MKAYNTPNDELRIESDDGEELIKITSDKTTITNLGDSEGSVLAIDAGTISMTPGWHTAQVVINEFPTSDEAEEEFAKWNAIANPKIKINCVVGKGVSASFTMIHNADYTAPGATESVKLFSCAYGAPTRFFANVCAFVFWDLVGSGYGMIVAISYKVEDIE